jgi:DNA-binding NtrC family response regulator
MANTQQGPSRLCLIEDDELVGESLAARFRLEGFDVEWCRDGASAQQALALRRFGVVVSDIRLPDCNGGELFLELAARHPRLPPFLFMTGFGTIDRAVDLLKAGAADYVTKPFDADLLVSKVRALASGYGSVSDSADSDALGVSTAMRRIAEALPRLARHASALLLSGESGVGKEHVAAMFHRHAGAATAPFVPVNCGAIPEPLLEAELFGFEKGAFTGAGKAKRGYFEQAHGGTVFLDEIGDMPPAMQVKLLRVLQEHRVQRLGSDAQIAVEFRLVCATHRDLKAMVEAGQFREDLYYRINVIHLHIPPLRERSDDIRWFVRHFIDGFNRTHPQERRRLDPRTEQALVTYAWPGNVRELKHAVERACIISPGPLLDAEAFFGDAVHAGPDREAQSAPLAEYLMDCEREYLRIVLDRHGGHMTHTAEALGIARKSLWDKMRRLGVQSTEREAGRKDRDAQHRQMTQRQS